jgi:hypothetical protein
MLCELADAADDVNLLTPLMGEKLLPGKASSQRWWEKL